MGYDVHITRATEWTDSEATPITLDEWLAYVASDPEMRLDGFAEARMPKGEVIRIEGKGLSVWTAWPGERRGEGYAWMEYRRGRIVVKNPDPAILKKMCSIAEQLGAQVQGDDGETYPDATDLSPPP
ncbi:MAG TPA: hypothetical protein VKE95_17915 [Burkholderiales bacterium]|nr:hypothetical protein [Burkholderiales bacterium]